MTEIVVADSLKNRRRTLDTQRRLKALRSLWRFSALTGLVGGLIWVMSWPEWTIRDRSQIQIEGNQLVSSQQLYQAFPLKLPQSIWQISTREVGQQMAQNPALAQVEVSRQLFPAQLRIAVAERKPVALAVSQQQPGYLDELGTFIPAQLYQQRQPQTKLPQSPKFWGYSPQYQSFWARHYPLIQQSPVKITEINGINPSNLTLTTALGIVYLGSDLGQFPRQLETLGRMQRLPGKVPRQRLAYIDLSQPERPTLQLKPAPVPQNQTASQKVKKP